VGVGQRKENIAATCRQAVEASMPEQVLSCSGMFVSKD
jgi:hypothetical protein